MIFMKKYTVIILVFFGLITRVYGEVQITEVMYDPKTGGEWLEVYNPNDSPLDLKGWKFFDGTNHSISASAIVPAGGYLILADDKNAFISAFNDVTTTIVDIVTSMNNDGDTLILRNASGVDISSMSYAANSGASKNDKSLQLIEGEFLPWFVSIGAPASATKEEVLAAAPATTSAPLTSSPSSTNTQTSPYHAWPSDMQIFVSAGGDRASVAGAEVIFSGKVLSASRKSLPNADLIWTFGDGGSDRGAQVKHTFHHPGRYVVLLDVISGDYIAKDQIFVEVVMPKISISSIATGTKAYIELFNETIYDLDFGGFVLSGDGLQGAHFTIPKNTIVLAGRKIIFPSEITQIKGALSKPELRFQNDQLIAGFSTTTENKTDTTLQEKVEPGKVADSSQYIELEQNSFVESFSKKLITPMTEKFFKENIQPIEMESLAETSFGTSAYATTSLDENKFKQTSQSTPAPAAVGLLGIKTKYIIFLGLLILFGIGGLLMLATLEKKEKQKLGLTKEVEEIKIIE